MPVSASLARANAISLPNGEVEPRFCDYPQLRYMGSKHRLLPWLREILMGLDFETAIDAFSGSGCVAYLLKTLGKEVRANDFLAFAADLAEATVVNSHATLSDDDIEQLLRPAPRRNRFIEREFKGIFFEDTDNAFLDQVWAHLPALPPPKQALARVSLYRACLKRVPRGVFTVAGLGRYSDGRRDLRLSLEEHFVESSTVFNRLIFDNGKVHRATNTDVFDIDPTGVDLAYLDPPYVPRADDNCYIKRYHFLEGLSTYWSDAEFHPNSKVRKLKKRYTPFSYRREAARAFDKLFSHFSEPTIVLSYSSNGFPDLDEIVSILRRYKRQVTVHSKDHRYHFGTHVAVRRSLTTEYVIIGQ